MSVVVVGTSNLLECGKCEGLWVDTATFEQICSDREKQSAVLGIPASVQSSESEPMEAVHYVPCPVCNTLMNRVNFAHCSHVVVDVCTKHGTWFDKDELHKIVEFIRDGGLVKAREQEIADLEEKRSRLRADVAAAAAVPDFPTRTTRYDGYDLAFDAVSAALKFFLK